MHRARGEEAQGLKTEQLTGGVHKSTAHWGVRAESDDEKTMHRQDNRKTYGITVFRTFKPDTLETEKKVQGSDRSCGLGGCGGGWVVCGFWGGFVGCFGGGGFWFWFNCWGGLWGGGLGGGGFWVVLGVCDGLPRRTPETGTRRTAPFEKASKKVKKSSGEPAGEEIKRMQAGRGGPREVTALRGRQEGCLSREGGNGAHENGTKRGTGACGKALYRGEKENPKGETRHNKNGKCVEP